MLRGEKGLVAAARVPGKLAFATLVAILELALRSAVFEGEKTQVPERIASKMLPSTSFSTPWPS